MKRILPVLILILIASGSVVGQTTYFGKNKVQYETFEWQYIQSRHFDIYFYDPSYETAKFAATVLESSYTVVTDQLNYRVHKRIPVFLYNSPNEFQQTNITSTLIGEGTGGFTESAKNRIVVPFNGSMYDFRHVLAHELTHAVVYDMLLGNLFTSLLSRRRLFDLPLWFAEGYAEYSSRARWNYRTDMIVRDATINGYLMPPDYIYGGMEYYEGTAMINYIVDNYGEEKLGDILKKGRVKLTMSKALKASIGIEYDEFWDKFQKEMKRRYWPEIRDRKEAKEISKALTDHTEHTGYRNEKPVFAPNGNYLAIFSDRSDYTEIYLISAIDGREIEKLVEGQRSGDLESLHSYLSGITFSPDAKSIAFISKSKGKDNLYFLKIDGKNIYKRKKYEFNSIINPVWSPDGTKIAMSILNGRYRDLYIYDMEYDTTYALMHDMHDDMEPSWFPDSKRLAFSSDRPHPETEFLETYEYNPDDSLNLWTIYSRYPFGNYSLFTIDIDTREITPLECGPGINREPDVSPDGKKIAFISNRNGIDNIYITEVSSPRTFAVTDLLTGASSPSWSPDGQQIAYSAFNEGGQDIYVLKEISAAGKNGVLDPTGYVKGEYYREIPKSFAAMSYFREHTEADKDNQSDTVVVRKAEFNGDFDHEDFLAGEGATKPNKGDGADFIAVAAADENDTDKVVSDSSAVNTEKPVSEDTGAVAQEQPADSSEGEQTAEREEPSDSTGAEQTAEQKQPADSSTIKDGEYIFVSSKSPDGKEDALAGMFTPMSDSSRMNTLTPAEQAAFDSVAANSKLPNGEYKVYDYKVKFTPDFVSGGFTYDTFFGIRGQSVFAFSDYTGDHQLILATDLVNTIDQSNIQFYYLYNRLKVNMGVGIFHTKNYYIDAYDHLFSDRLYGATSYFTYPFSKFFRAELSASQYFIDRKFHDSDDPRNSRSTKATVAEFSLVQDNILWGITGPINGRRSRLDISGAKDFFDSNNISYYSVEFDYRKYWHIRGLFSTAFRFSGGASWGSSPKRYFLGGTTNYIGQTVVDAQVYNEENLYFSDVVTPLRGFEYYELTGTRYFLSNFEFRYPFIDYLKVDFPLPMAIRYVTGAWFFDLGSAWENDSAWRGASSAGGAHLQDIKSAFGFGIRANLGIFVLRYDLAWKTDFNTVAHHPKYYFSLGADF